jgi:hypothetical protein
MPLSAPRLAPTEPPQTEPAAAQNAVGLHGFQEIARTGRLEPAASSGTGGPREDRRDDPLVGANQKSDDREHQGARIKARFARRNHSSSSAR